MVRFFYKFKRKASYHHITRDRLASYINYTLGVLPV